VRSTTLPPSSTTSTYDLSTPPTSPIDNDFESMASDFDRHRHSLMTQGQEGGWEAELRRYLKDLPPNVTKDTDVVEWWQVRFLSVVLLIGFLMVFRTMAMPIQQCDTLLSTFCHVRLHLSHASDFSLVGGKL
jgi:hypothetical protein